MRVRVNTEDLLSTVRANRAEHVAQFEQANERYRKSMRVFFLAQAHSIEHGHDFERYFDGDAPTTYAEDYDRAIGMLELHRDPVIELGSEDYSRLVKDDWDWKRTFARTNSRYV